MNSKQYDAILYVEPILNEALWNTPSDPRVHARKTPSATKGFEVGFNWDDPRMYASNTFGSVLQNSLSGMGRGYSAKVCDFGKWVTAEVTYHNHVTGRSASKTFLIVFKHKGDGIILSTSNKYRSISGVDQAASYIKSASSALESACQNKL